MSAQDVQLVVSVMRYSDEAAYCSGFHGHHHHGSWLVKLGFSVVGVVYQFKAEMLPHEPDRELAEKHDERWVWEGNGGDSMDDDKSAATKMGAVWRLLEDRENNR